MGYGGGVYVTVGGVWRGCEVESMCRWEESVERV